MRFFDDRRIDESLELLACEVLESDGASCEHTRKQPQIRFSWLARPLRRHLAAITEAEHMTARALLVVAVRELVAAYHGGPSLQAETGRPSPASPQPPADAETLETVGTPRRDAPSRLGERVSRPGARC